MAGDRDTTGKRNDGAGKPDFSRDVLQSLREQHTASLKDCRVMPPDTKQALAMLNAFASVGATAFDVSLFDIDENQQGFQSGRSVDELRRSMSARLEAASRTKNCHRAARGPKTATATAAPGPASISARSQSPV
jgi:hypothetical protein